MRARSALFTLFGDVVRPAGGEAWLSTLTGLMGALGFTPEATRTALHRMAADGWVTPRKQGRYAAYHLTPGGVDRLEEAAARIYRLRAVAWDGRWRLLVLLAGRGDGREDLGRALAWMGHGRLSPDLWVSPRQPGEGLGALLAQHGQDDAHRFTTEPGDTDRDRRIVDDAWDLAELHAAQEAFSRRWSAAPPTTEPEAAFRERIELVHHWRSFLRLDPGLPEPLLPPDPRGRAALALFRARYEALEAPGWRFVAAVSARSPDGPALVPQQPPSPFALGVDLEAGASA